MQHRPPSLHQQQCLRVMTATAASLVVEVDGVPYYVTCWPRRDNPPGAGPLRPGHWVRVYNTPAPGGPTLVERLTPDGAGDGCTYLLRDYDRVAHGGPTAVGARPSVRASRARQSVESPSMTALRGRPPPPTPRNSVACPAQQAPPSR
jgi:hypothetical protein